MRLNQVGSSQKPVLSESWFPHAKRFWQCLGVLFPPEVKPQRLKRPLVFMDPDLDWRHLMGPVLHDLRTFGESYLVLHEVRIELTAPPGKKPGVGRSGWIWFHEDF